MGDQPVIEQMRGTFGFERQLKLGYNASAKASAFIQFDIVPGNEEQTEANIRAAAVLAKISVLDELGIDVVFQANGVVAEKPLEDRGVAMVNAVFPNAEEQRKADEPAAAPQRSQGGGGGGTRERATSSSDNPTCPKCDGPMWDNRNSKTSPRQPDFRCKRYKPADGGCEGVVWPPKGGN